jgi:hypothetical protein
MQETPMGLAAGEGASGLLAVEAAATDAGTGRPATVEDDDGSSHRGVAVLLGAAAITAAVVGALAAGLSSDATDAWNSAVRSELKRATGAVEDVRFVYQAEFGQALTVISARSQAAAYSAAAAADPTYAAAMTIAANGQLNAASAMEPSIPLVSESKYALGDGGVDLGKRLADQRAEAPDLVAINPDATQSQGDALAAKASWLLTSLLPLGACALVGTLAQALRRWRRPLLGVGTVLLGIGVVVAAAAEVLA